MTTSSQLRLVDHGRKVWKNDVTTENTVSDFYLSSFPPNTILCPYAKSISLMPYATQLVDASVAIFALYGILQIGPKQHGDDTMYATHIIANNVECTFSDALPGLAGGFVSDDYSFTDDITEGATHVGGGGGMMFAFLGGTQADFVQGWSLDGSPGFFTVRNLGPWIGIAVRVTYLDSSITAFNMLKYAWSSDV